MSKRYHTIYSMRLDACQEMLMDRDVNLIRKDSSIISKLGAKAACDKFLEELHDIFGGDEDIKKFINTDVLLQRMRLNRNNLIMLHEGLKCCYWLNETPERTQILDKLKKTYRHYFHDYPTVVVSKTSDEIAKMTKEERDEFDKLQSEQVSSVLKRVLAEIERLNYRIKEETPIKEAKPKKDNDMGLEPHIDFVQQVMPELGYTDRSMSVHAFSNIYNSALVRYNKIIQQNG